MYGTLISSVTVGAGGASSIDFTSIPGTYTDLIVVVSARGDAGIATGDLIITFNGASTGMTSRMLYGSGSAATSATYSAGYAVIAYNGSQQNSATASIFGNAQIYIPNYSGATNKSVSIDAISENNASTAGQNITAGAWASTAAITSMSISSSGNWMQYSTAYLYGLTKGSDGATVA